LFAACFGLCVSAAGVFLVAAAASPESGGDDDDRPPIIVNNGSIIFNGGDPLDVFKHWRPWTPTQSDDVKFKNGWSPKHENAKTVDSFKVVIAGVPGLQPPCDALMKGVGVTIDFRPDGHPAVQFRVARHHVYQFPFTFKHEPAIVPPAGVVLNQDPPSSGPPTLSYGGLGAITAVAVDSTSCQIPNPNAVKGTLLVYIKPSPEDK
jgi:hypothetical protein